MNPEPQPAEFDPSEELERLADPEQQHFGLPTRVFFYLIETCRSIEAYSAPSFTVEAVLDLKTKAPAGCHVEFVVRGHSFRIDVNVSTVRLWASEADEADSSDARRWLVFESDAANPTSWQSLLKKIGDVEHFSVVGAHADKLRLMWTQFLAERKRRDDERGF